jgi:diaminopimelate epimerase
MRLRKYHGLGNDFLILLDADGRQPVDAPLARAICDRHRGAGADGMIRITRNPELTMELFNADGGRAETSGNGLRCVGRAVVDAGWVEPGEFDVATDAGQRRLHVSEDGTVRVDMGTALVGAPLRVPWDDIPLAWSNLVSIGNPHLVLGVEDPAYPVKVDLDQIQGLQMLYPGGINVEVVATGPGRDELTMRVWERGVGETLACGSGACAAVAAAWKQGRVGDRVTVHQPGGDVIVEVADGGITLTGPAEYICNVEWPDRPTGGVESGHAAGAAEGGKTWR